MTRPSENRNAGRVQSHGATVRNVLIVEDEADLAEMVVFHLKREGYACRRVGDGQAALAEVRRQIPDVILLDRMLPGMSGDDVLVRLKRDPGTAGVPVIMMTAKADEADELGGLALGADDYVRKPFSMKLLEARVAAALRRETGGAREQEVIAIGPVQLDRGRHDVTVEGRSVTLTPTEFRVLRELMLAGGRVLTRDRLIDAVLGQGVAVTNRTIDVHIAAVRRKLSGASEWIHTIRGVGYAFREPAEDSGDEA